MTGASRPSSSWSRRWRSTSPWARSRRRRPGRQPRVLHLRRQLQAHRRPRPGADRLRPRLVRLRPPRRHRRRAPPRRHRHPPVRSLRPRLPPAAEGTPLTVGRRHRPRCAKPAVVRHRPPGATLRGPHPAVPRLRTSDGGGQGGGRVVRPDVHSQRGGDHVRAPGRIALALVRDERSGASSPRPSHRPERAPGPADGSPDGSAPDRPCTAMAVRSCALPYPSDEFSVADPSTSTGRRLEVPQEGLVPAAALRQLGPGATRQRLRWRRRGDQGRLLGVVAGDLRGRPVHPIHRPSPKTVAKWSRCSTRPPAPRCPCGWSCPSTPPRRGAPRTVVMAWPRLRWEHGHTYVARMAKVSGEGVTPSPAQAMGWSTPWVERLRSTWRGSRATGTGRRSCPPPSSPSAAEPTPSAGWSTWRRWRRPRTIRCGTCVSHPPGARR